MVMKNIDNVNDVQKVLHQVYLNCNMLMNSCLNIDENKTMSGSTTHELHNNGR